MNTEKIKNIFISFLRCILRLLSLNKLGVRVDKNLEKNNL